jgi:hypothetical protein
MELDDKQKLFFESLKHIKDANVEIFSSYLYPESRLNSTLLEKEYKYLQSKLTTDEEIKYFKKIQNEIIGTVIYQIMELIDGYGDLEFEVDIINKGTKRSLRKDIELHDSFMNYLIEYEKDSNE